ncbi:hypothetical protein GPECTOR_13g667 [Gonium pectorale]|uniref:Ankyrin repeat domain-containing protein n=1 Tax=Gonium pectorale TaxID=33097 RepID=A0A150GPC9_GONPE|nr:hypothetical protein GPECTOR_13g667 [Gonium pectorale]|eukprot:KXZ51180.1 hypothetical protein GPECTOR_13g667 [Gonium pectorale]
MEDSAARVWALQELRENIVRFLPPNDVACTIRLLDKAAARCFEKYTTVRLSMPSPPREYAWRWGSPTAMRSLTLEQQRKLLCMTARTGCLSNLQTAFAAVRCGLSTEVMEAAASGGNVEACAWLKQRGAPWGSALAAAAEGSHHTVCWWLLDCGCPLEDSALRAATRAGYTGLLELLIRQRRAADAAPESYYVGLRLQAAAQGCDLPTFQQLHRAFLGPSLPAAGSQPPQPPPVMPLDGFARNLVAAAASSHTPDWAAKVEWLEKEGYPPTSAACCRVASRPDALARLTWLRGRGYPVDSATVVEAARAGNLDALVYLLQEAKVRPSQAASSAAVRRGDLAMLRALHLHGCQVDLDMVTAAAYGGHLHVVEWLLETLGEGPRAQLSTIVAESAAYSGNVRLLARLRELGCPMDAHTFNAAAEAGCEVALEWLVEHGCPMGIAGKPYVNAYDNRDRATLRALRRLGVPWCQLGATFTRCLEGAIDLPCLRWLLEEGCPVDWHSALALARRRRAEEGMAEVLTWLEETWRQQRWGRLRKRWTPGGLAARMAGLAAELAWWPCRSQLGH